MSQLIGLDLGTTGAKAIAVETKGGVLAVNSKQYPLSQPNQGWSEQNADDWWEAIIEVIKTLLANERVNPEGIEGLAMSGQMHGSVFLDDQGEVIRPPILWNDGRTTKQCNEIRKKVGENKMLEYVGNPPLEGFTAPKLLWLRQNEPENHKDLSTLLLPKDFIIFKLTGRRVTDHSDAAGTVLYDVKNRKWSEEVCKALEIDSSILPEVLNSVDVVGKISQEAANLTGLPEEVKIIAGGGDNACSAVGNGVIREGLFMVSLGSSGIVLAHSEEMQVDQGARIHSFNHSVPDKWYLMGVTLSAGLSFRWYKEKFAKTETEVADEIGENVYDLLTEEASLVPPGSEGLIFLPYLSGERTPHKNAKARGTFFGIANSHSKRHFARSVLEGVTFGLRDSLDLIKEMGIHPEQIRVTGGGAKSRLWRQIQADVFDQEIVTTEVDEGPAFGAALLSSVGAGIYKNIEEAVSELVKIETFQSPDPHNVKVYEDLLPIFRSLYTSLEDDYEALYEFNNECRIESKT